MSIRADYPHQTQIQTRWMDNDIYAHVNNVIYYSYFDTVINGYLMAQGALDPQAGNLIGVCAESHCKFLAQLAFPELIDAALRVEHLGNSSVRYALALFSRGSETPAADGWFVHVFVDRHTRRPAPLSPELRQALEALKSK